MVYKMILHIIGLILAFHIRKVKIEPLNDSKYSAIIMYCSFIFLILAITVIFGVPGINGKGASWTVFVFIEVCIFLGLTFIPKVSSHSYFFQVVGKATYIILYSLMTDGTAV